MQKSRAGFSDFVPDCIIIHLFLVGWVMYFFVRFLCRFYLTNTPVFRMAVGVSGQIIDYVHTVVGYWVEFAAEIKSVNIVISGIDVERQFGNYRILL